MTTEHIASKALVYNGAVIRDRNDMLSLTDMWKAQGSDIARKPSEWLRQEGAQRFIEFLAESQGVSEVGNSHFGLVSISKGGAERGATFAHWQIGLAYAKYLSPEFHMWCNEVVRERMEGKPSAPMPIILDESTKNTIGGIVRGVIHKQLIEVMPQLVAGYVAEHNLSIADGLTAGEVCDLSRVTAKYPRGISARVSKRMAQFCAVRKIEVPVTRLGRVRAQVFPTHAAREWLDLEGRGLIKRWLEEKKGQTVLRLVPAVAAE